MKTKQEYLELSDSDISNYIIATQPFTVKVARFNWVKDRAEVLELRDRVKELEALLRDTINHKAGTP